MKVFKKLVLFILIGSTAAIYSCSPDETQSIPNLAVTANKTTAAPGDKVDIAITTSSSGTVKTLVIEEQTAGSSGKVKLLDSSINQANYGYTYEYEVPQGATGKKDIIVTVTDNLSQTNSKTVTITIAGSTAGVKSCDNEVLGSYNNTKGSFFASKTCAIYTVGEAKNNQSAVDFIYFYGSTNNATLAAPDDADANTIATFDLGSWNNPKNATRFKVLNTFDFNNATATSIVAAYTASTSLEESKANSLGAGQMYGFKTADGRHGVIRVNSITGTDAGTINIDVKSTM